MASVVRAHPSAAVREQHVRLLFALFKRHEPPERSGHHPSVVCTLCAAALTRFVPSAWPTVARWSFMRSSRLPRRRRVRTASTQSFSRSLWNRFVGGCALVTGWACSVLMRDDGPDAQLEDKHLERRALLAECCGALTPFVKVKRRRPTSRLYAGPQLTRANSMDPGGPGGMCT